MHILLKDRKKLSKEELNNSHQPQLINSPYPISLIKATSNVSNPSLLSSVSSLRYSNSDVTCSSSSSIIEPLTMSQKEIDSFDIIDSLDYDDIDDTIMEQEISFQQREALIQRLYEVEKNHLEILDLVLNSFILPLRRNTKQSSLSFLGIRKSPCTEREMRWLFANLEDIHQFHLENIKSLDDRLSIWGPTQIISDIIQTWFSGLQQHYHTYFDSYDVLVTTYERLSRYQPFKNFVETVIKNDNLKSTTLLSLLQSPTACIQRYQEILTNLADTTSSMHPDYVGLIQCKTRIQSIAIEFKSKIEDSKNVNQVHDILRTMIGHPLNIKAERRLFLKSNFIQTVDHPRCYFLFSDVLVIARQKKHSGLHYKDHVVLDRAKLRALSGDSWPIEITSPFQGIDSLNTTFIGSPTTHVIRTFKKEEQTKWMIYLENAITARLEQQKQQSKIMTANRSKHIAASSSSAHSLKRQSTFTSSSQSSTNS